MPPQKINETDSVEKFLDQLKPRLEELGFKSINDIAAKGAVAVSQATGLDLKTCQDICNKAEQQKTLHNRICVASHVRENLVCSVIM